MRLRYISLILSGIALAQGLYAQLQSELARVPVVFRLDKSLEISSMAMELPRTDFGRVTLEELVDQYPDPESQTFADLVERMKSGDPMQVMEKIRLMPNENPEGRLEVIQAYQQAFAQGWDQMRVIARYQTELGNSWLWEVPTANGPFVRSFTLAGAEGQYEWVDEPMGSSLHVINTLLTQSEQLQISSSNNRLKSEYRYSELMPMTGIDLLFDGVVTRWDPFSDEYPDHPVLAMYWEAFQAFESMDMEAYASFFTPHSQDKFVNWIEGMPEEEFEAYHASVLAGREVRFILDADPVFIVFYNTPERVAYDTILKRGDNYSFTSFYIEGFVDDLFQSEALFIEPVLLSAVEPGVDDLVMIPGEVASVPSGNEAVEEASEMVEDQQIQEEEVSEDSSDDSEDEPIDDGDSGILLLIILSIALLGLILVIYLKGKSKK